MQENEKENQVLLYPNPAEEMLTLAVEPERIGECYKIVDQLGKTIRIGALEKMKHQIPISGIESGIYTVIIGNQSIKNIAIK